MTAFDYIVIGIFIFSITLSVMRGLLREILSLVNWSIAFYVTNKFGPSFAVHLPFVESLSPQMKTLIGCAAAFILCMVIGAIFIALLSKVIKAAGLGFADRGLGAIFGAARAALILLAVMIGAGFTSLPKSEMWQYAMLSGYAENAVKAVKPHLPENVAQWIKY
jgi:membrane protein required for colicin V production